MSANSNTDKSYKIETGGVSAGNVEDPVTGESHTIESLEDKRGGTIEVTNPYSARTLVKESNSFEFAESGPSDHEVQRAQQSALGMESVPDHVVEFAEQYGQTLGKQSLEASEGFDPVASDGPTNDTQLKVTQMYETLQQAGYRSEAKYLRLLPSTDRQDEFVAHVREVLDL